jgi:hypothetical protein
VAALGGEPVNGFVPILAHFGHWYISGPVYLAPVLLVIAWLKWTSWRERRSEKSKSGRASRQAKRAGRSGAR